MKRRRRNHEPLPPDWRRRFDLPNLDTLESLSRGELPPSEPPGPDDVGTSARLLLSFPSGMGDG